MITYPSVIDIKKTEGKMRINSNFHFFLTHLMKNNYIPTTSLASLLNILKEELLVINKVFSLKTKSLVYGVISVQNKSLIMLH